MQKPNFFVMSVLVKMIMNRIQTTVTHRPEGSYVWIVKTPLQSEVALTQKTKEEHIEGKHSNDIVRMQTFDMLPGIISQPRFIYLDQDYETNKRLRYCDTVSVSEIGHLQTLVVIVDTDREPHEVATWMVKSNSKQEKTGEGRILYDSRADKKSTSQI